MILVLSVYACRNEADQPTHQITEEITAAKSVKTPDNLKLFNQIKEKDSLLFQIGFNQIDTAQVSLLTSIDFEFYHDQHGITDSKNAFIGNIDGIRDLPFKTWRTLVEGSMEVFPLYKENNKALYGAIQTGIHEFYQQHIGDKVRKTNTAKFTHLWIIEDGKWRLSRVLSYDHQIPKD